MLESKDNSGSKFGILRVTKGILDLLLQAAHSVQIEGLESL